MLSFPPKPLAKKHFYPARFAELEQRWKDEPKHSSTWHRNSYSAVSVAVCSVCVLWKNMSMPVASVPQRARDVRQRNIAMAKKAIHLEKKFWQMIKITHIFYRPNNHFSSKLHEHYCYGLLWAAMDCNGETLFAYNKG